MEKFKKWYRFQNWIIKSFSDGNEKSEDEVWRKLHGYDTIKRVESYVKRYYSEVKIIHCDDAVNAGSTILLIPHPEFGITVVYIPQCTTIQNSFFLYPNHQKNLIKALNEMKKQYNLKV